jgi:hypothetical protein
MGDKKIHAQACRFNKGFTSCLPANVTVAGKAKGGAKIKPVQPTVIKDKKIVREVIAEIHRKPTQKDIVRLRERREVLKRAMSR